MIVVTCGSACNLDLGQDSLQDRHRRWDDFMANPITFYDAQFHDACLVCVFAYRALALGDIVTQAPLNCDTLRPGQTGFKASGKTNGRL